MKSTLGPGLLMSDVLASWARTVQTAAATSFPAGTATAVPLVCITNAAGVKSLPFTLTCRFTVALKGFVITISSGAPTLILVAPVGFLIVIDCSSALKAALAAMLVLTACCSEGESFVFGNGPEKKKPSRARCTET